MRNYTAQLVALLLMVLTLMEYTTAAADVTEKWQSRSDYYTISFRSELEPLTINRIHYWIIHIEDEQGKPVTNATMVLSGGMPEHNHGLPTQPRMTENLGNGDYRVEGMRFHMAGYWELTIVIDADGRSDTVILDLTI